MSKYKKLFKEMVLKNEELFNNFKAIHTKFLDNNSLNRAEFNRIGEEVVELIRIYIDELCRTSEGSGYGNYTSKLSDKFWNAVRQEFEAIDEVGIEVE